MIKNILHIILAVVVVLSSMVLPIQSHFCQGNFRYATLFSDHKGCCNSEIVCTSIQKSDTPFAQVSKAPCCLNKLKFSDTFLLYNESKIHANQEIIFPQFVANISSKDIFSKITFSNVTAKYLNFKPPLIIRDISILYQIFLC